MVLSGVLQSAFKMHMCFFVRFFHSHCFFSAEIFRKCFLVLFFEKNVLFLKLEVRVDHFWNKIFSKTDESGDKFIILPKMVKCALVLCPSNADVERSLSVNKRMLTKQNVGMKDETLRGLRAIKMQLNMLEA